MPAHVHHLKKITSQIDQNESKLSELAYLLSKVDAALIIVVLASSRFALSTDRRGSFAFVQGSSVGSARWLDSKRNGNLI